MAYGEWIKSEKYCFFIKTFSLPWIEAVGKVIKYWNLPKVPLLERGGNQIWPYTLPGILKKCKNHLHFRYCFHFFKIPGRV